jgi:outer membrane protein
LRGGGIHTNEHSLRVAHFGSEMTKVRTKLNVISILVSVDIGYWRLYAARRELEVRKLEYDLAVAQLESSQRRFEAGEIIELDVILSEDAAAQRLEAIILAENSVRDREREIKQVMNEAGLEVDSPTILVSVTEPTPVKYDMDTEGLLAMAVENRMELLERELQIMQADDNIEFAKNRTLPSLSFDYTYNVNALGTTMNESYDLLWRNRFVDHRLGLNLTVPLGNKAAKSQLRQEILRRQQQLVSQEQLKISIKRDVLGAVDQMEANWNRVIASRRSTILSERSLSASQRQYDLGRLILNELLDAQTRYANALSSEMSALVEYQISQLNLALSVGALLSATRVEFETDLSNFESK